MTAGRARRTPLSPTGGRAPRYRRHELALPDGGKLRLAADGAIERLDASGSTTHAWSPSDLDWPNQAIRFGLRPEAATAAPHGQRVSDKRLP